MTKELNNEIDNNPHIKLDKNNINNEEDKGGSCRFPKKEDKEDKDNAVSGFKRTKTKHFK